MARMTLKLMVGTLMIAMLGCRAEIRESTDSSGGSGGSDSGVSGTQGERTGGNGAIGGSDSSSGSGGTTEAEAGDVCSGYPEDCFPLCKGGQCYCYCDSGGRDSGASVGGTSAAGEGGTGAASGSGGTAGDSGTGPVDCDCVRGGYAPVCGEDGTTYDAICGIECVPVAIACTGPCPCESSECTEDCTAGGFTCCNGKCVNTENDRNNCGECATQCSDKTPYCEMGTCTEPPCYSTNTCDAAEECCGSSCCSGGQICCFIMQGPWFLQCVDPVEGTCPRGCPMCVCADPDTMVATPDGERRIAEIKVGDLVYSVEHDSVVVVPVLETRRTPVTDHQVIRVTLVSGRILEISAPHPTAEGGSFGELAAGQALDGILITAVETIPYHHAFTYDILPDSNTGVYIASGVAIGSTLKDARR